MNEIVSADSENYGSRYVAFLDILGFSALVQHADKPDWRAALVDVVQCLRTTLANNEHSGFRCTQFSDCIVISVPSTQIGLAQVFAGAVMLATNLIQRSILLRGGIVKRNMMHTSEMLLGPALVEAYRFDAAGGPPRIVLSDEVASDAINSEHFEHLACYVRNDEYDLSPMLNTLVDFQLYDALPRVGMAVLDYPAKSIARNIAHQCYECGHPAAIRAKWLWLERYWNDVVSVRNILPTTEEARKM